MSLPLLGLGNVEVGGAVLPATEALATAGLRPLSALAAKEGLSLTNGTAAMCAIGVLGTLRAEQLADSADIAGCLSLEALHGTTRAFDPRIHALRPLPRQAACAAFLRSVLEGSHLVRPDSSPNVQDAYTLRCMPQVHGAAHEAIAYARWVFEQVGSTHAVIVSFAVHLQYLPHGSFDTGAQLSH
jgi:histidine ammonia-lyase